MTELVGSLPTGEPGAAKDTVVPSGEWVVIELFRPPLLNPHLNAS
jgi:hypothetical protein